MSNKISDIYKQTKKKPASKSAGVKGAVPSTSSHLQPDPNPELETLKQFDLSLEFGPCAGITRLERWERAHKHGLNPPEEVKNILFRHPTDDLYTRSLWKDYSI